MAYVVATLLSIAIVALCIVVHYEALVVLSRIIHQPRRHRWMVIVLMHGLLAAHVVEVWLFGAGHYVATEWLNLGEVHLHADGRAITFFDHVYYSAMVYSTVGFGDMVPTGAVRMLSSTEAIAGLTLITWSASFTFLQMERIWRR